MKKKLMFLAVAVVLVVVSVAQARRSRAVIIQPVTVNPLAGYADQVQ